MSIPEWLKHPLPTLFKDMGVRQRASLRVAFGFGIIAVVLIGIYLANKLGGRGPGADPISQLMPRTLSPSPTTFEKCNELYAFTGTGPLMKQPKTHYTRQEFDKLLSYAFYSDTDPDSWLVNGGALGAMCHLNLPTDDPKLRVYEEVEMTKAANTFLRHPEPVMRWQAAKLIETQHLLGSESALRAALRAEKNPVVAQEMRKALAACGG